MGDGMWIHLIAALFAVFMVLGRSFEKTNSLYLFSGSGGNFITSVILLIFWFFVFDKMIRWLFDKWNSCQLLCGEEPEENDRRRFWIMFGVLLLFRLPFAILAYPAKFMGDSVWIIRRTIQWSIDGTISGNHPMLYMAFVKFFAWIGQLVGSYNVGMFLYSAVQMLFVNWVAAYSLCALRKWGIRQRAVTAAFVYFCLHPVLCLYMPVITKDLLYSGFLLLFYLMLFQFITGRMTGRKEYGLWAFSIFGVLFFRHEGEYVVLFTLAAALLFKALRKKALYALLFTLILLFGMTKIVYPLVHVEKGSMKEVLSIPFQQTARYVRDHAGEVTPHEREVIGLVLDYDSLAEYYKENISDSVKITYTENDAALKDYFAVWFQMLLKHPGTYVQATMNNYYQYFYPGSSFRIIYTFEYSENIIKEQAPKMFGMPPALKDIRESAEKAVLDVMELPVVSLFSAPAFYVWTAMLGIGFALWKKNKTGILFGLPTLVTFLVYITGPVNGYYCRYEIPLILYLPVFMLLELLICRQGENPSCQEKRPE